MAERRGDRLRLRAWLVDPDGIVKEALGRTYDLDNANAIADFLAEFDRATGINIERLFRTDFCSTILDALIPECAS